MIALGFLLLQVLQVLLAGAFAVALLVLCATLGLIWGRRRGRPYAGLAAGLLGGALVAWALLAATWPG